MGNDFSRSDLQDATTNQIGLYVARIGQGYEKYEEKIIEAGLDGGYLIFKFDQLDSVFNLLGITNPTHIDILKYRLTKIYTNETSISQR